MTAPLYTRPGINSPAYAPAAFALATSLDDLRPLRAVFGVLTQDQQERALQALGWQRVMLPPPEPEPAIADPAQYMPDPEPTTGRRLVTARQWAGRPTRLDDAAAYWYDADAARAGLDPWTAIQDVIHEGTNKYDVWFLATGQALTVEGGQGLYIHSDAYELLTQK